MAGGIRQIDGGAKIDQTLPEGYKSASTQRVANLTLDERGEVAGTVTMTWSGAPALHWRQASLRGDSTSLRNDLRTAMEHMLPGGTEVKIDGIENIEDYEKPLKVVYDIKGPIASSAGKRMLVPGDIFVMNEKPAFPREKREVPVYFEYPQMVQDAVRFKLPAGLAIESVPVAENAQFQKYAAYSLTSEATPTSVTVRRDLAVGEVLFSPEEYPGLRAFYTKFETKDQEPLVLKPAETAAVSAPSGN